LTIIIRVKLTVVGFVWAVIEAVCNIIIVRIEERAIGVEREGILDIWNTITVVVFIQG